MPCGKIEWEHKGWQADKGAVSIEVISSLNGMEEGLEGGRGARGMLDPKWARQSTQCQLRALRHALHLRAHSASSKTPQTCMPRPPWMNLLVLLWCSIKIQIPGQMLLSGCSWFICPQPGIQREEERDNLSRLSGFHHRDGSHASGESPKQEEVVARQRQCLLRLTPVAIQHALPQFYFVLMFQLTLCNQNRRATNMLHPLPRGEQRIGFFSSCIPSSKPRTSGSWLFH